MKAKLEKVMNATNKYKAIRQAEKFTNKMIGMIMMFFWWFDDLNRDLVFSLVHTKLSNRS